MTRTIFTDWFNNYFGPFVDAYNKAENLENKALLVVDNSTSHPSDVNSKFPHIKIAFLAPNTTSLIQPMDQGIISILKAYYLKGIMENIIHATSADSGIDVQTYWKTFNIKQAIDIVDWSRAGVTKNMLNGVWRKLWPTCVTTKSDKIKEAEEVCSQQIVEVSKRAGFLDMTAAHVTEHLCFDAPDATSEELVSLDCVSRIADTPGKKQSLKDFIDSAEALAQNMSLVEENHDERCRFRQILDGLMYTYKKTYDELNEV